MDYHTRQAAQDLIGLRVRVWGRDGDSITGTYLGDKERSARATFAVIRRDGFIMPTYINWRLIGHMEPAEG